METGTIGPALLSAGDVKDANDHVLKTNRFLDTMTAIFGKRK